MKKILFTFIFCIQLSHIVAQENQTIQETENLPNWPVMLSNLNTTQITSGVLIDKVTTFANIINYNTFDSNISNSNHFAQALSELYRASDQTKFISLTELKNRTATTTSNNSVDVGIINTTFHKLNFNEENPSAGGVTFNQSTGKFVAVVGQPSFIGKKISIMSPLKEFITGSAFQFNFKNNLILNNTTTTIKTLVVDFIDGSSPVTIISNSTIVVPTKTVNYTDSGMKSLKFTITYSDNTTLETYGKIYVKYDSDLQTLAPNNTNSSCYELLKDKGTFTSTLPFQGYTENSPIYGKTEYTIFYGYNNTAKQMVKPIIIVDGFDPKDKRKVQDCDCEQDPTCVLNNDDGDNGVFNPTKHESLEDLMNYNTINSTTGLPQVKNLISELRTKGYDVIVINNPTYTSTNVAGQSVTVDGGADYIERNAMTLVSFIKNYVKPNQTLAGSNQQLVLVGPSMGGQITRFALAYMEKKFAETGLVEWKHNARLWISVDSPHLGANIPVGAQANIWFLADRLGKEPAKIQYYEELNSVAGKQQIISQFQNARETGYLNGNSFFTTYYNNLNSNGVAGSNGYPVSNTSFRKIAMVNGSLTGKKDASEQQTFLYMRGYARGLWPFQNSTVTLLRLQDNFMPASYQTGTVFKGDGQNSTFNIGFNHWYIDFSHPRYNLKVNNNSVKGSMDVVPGGYFRTAKYIREAVSEGLSDAGVRQETRDYIENHSFIPTFSAIGHLNPNQNWGNPLNTNLTCPTNKQTPFDSYYGTASNTEHTSFTKEGIDWLFKELDGIPQAPSFPMQDNLLVGAELICNTNVTYTFSDICKLPSSATWSVSPNLQIVSTTDYSITVSQVSNGQGTITATFQNGQTVTKNVWVGKPSFYLQYNYFEPQPVKSTLEMVSDQPNLTINQQGITSTQFIGIKDGVTIFDTPGSFFTIRANPNSVDKVFAYATNACGTTMVELDWLNLFRQSNNSTVKYYKVFPNPTHNVVHIDLRDNDNSPSSNIITGELFDLMGQSKAFVQFMNNRGSVDVRNLNEGIYVLKIYINNQVESHQIIVE
ncbi:Protein of unknown function precursor [Flavobacterium indicum GPTSA100-9 = DSM 17447]|uniref:Secretion system C-terminal sorting domain-containing protein n=1 Tax=Flavobacterium indicum (strain DSM 17447 / CIP 109464 / GPTSA100-9) TaxID=1094466 RepID=H8XP03_FLAIG|nr:T9SS type A sorting domain-containing protein [Flavobacterium indicum]CCG52270.1 Protein of unknown function precursor [Flavobacterium indicum GPTSA100-9 = DSM 17447]